MHRIHHQRDKHYKNFSDFPIWDMLFGTFENPPSYYGKCGFRTERERKLKDMLFHKNVNDPFPPGKK
jgi:sterol desaturase/sphingolipid hydroxylase (fatty acid hydroxylase superfamily)